MSDLKYVCLSDLHLGADYSVLTYMGDDGKTSLLEPSATLAALGTALRQYVSALSGKERPTLILLGDALDLGLSPTGAVAQAFKRFIEALFPAHAEPVFSSRVLCVPGNHDHHLWRSAQDQYFLDHLDENWDKTYIPDLLQHTSLFEQQSVSCGLMTELMRGYPHLQEAAVSVSYPNLGLLDEGRSRCIVLHHGHYLDSLYRAMSTLSGQLSGRDQRPKTVAKIERENGSWVDFLWSGLGGGGVIARDAMTLYEATRSALASHEFSQQLSQGLLAQLSKDLGVGPGTEITHGITLSNIVRGLVDLTFVRGTESERDSYSSVLSADAVADLRWYLAGPLRKQFAEVGKLEPGGEPSFDDVSFVFGHTHKPFQDELAVKDYPQPVAVYNTGGWVMDQPTMAPTQGAAAIFIDDELNLASLRLFNDPLNGACAPVHAAGVGGFRDDNNALLKRMRQELCDTKQKQAWDAFSDKAGKALELHALMLLKASSEAEVRS